jgi:hypothetical protein
MQPSSVTPSEPTIRVCPEDITEETISMPPRSASSPASAQPYPSDLVDTDQMCPYDGAAFGTRPQRRCRTCKTAHHTDCWQANGGCTTFGCPEAPAGR